MYVSYHHPTGSNLLLHYDEDREPEVSKQRIQEGFRGVITIGFPNSRGSSRHLDCLSDVTVLVVEDEPLIALDVATCLQDAGAIVLCARGVKDGLRLAATPNLCVAVLDYQLVDGNGSELCAYLEQLGIPYIIYSGYEELPDACDTGTILSKPASAESLVSNVLSAIGHDAV